MHRKLLLTIGLLLVLSGSVSAKTYFVSNNGPIYFDIQHALDAAYIHSIGSADSAYWIFVKPGTYSGEGNRDIVFRKMDVPLTLTSMVDPFAPDWNVIENTIIDCGGTETDPHRAFIFNSYSDPCDINWSSSSDPLQFYIWTTIGHNAVVRGLTIINGFTVGDNVVDSPTGVGKKGDDPYEGPWVDWTIEDPADPNETDPDEIFFVYPGSGEDAVGDGYGGAILCGYYTGGHPAGFIPNSGASPKIEYCIFKDNTVAGARGGDGANGLNGPWTYPESGLDEDPVFDDGQWGGHGGHGDGWGYGGAVACVAGSSPIVRGCKFENNIAMGGLGGDGGIGGTSADDGDTGTQGRGGSPGDAGAIDDPGELPMPGYGGFGILGVGSKGFGGAIYTAGNNNDPNILGSIFLENEATQGEGGDAGERGDGDGIDFGEVYASLERPSAVFTLTCSPMLGGAMYCDSHTDVQIYNSTFTSNEAYYVWNKLDFVVIPNYNDETSWIGPDAVNYTDGGAVWCDSNNQVIIDNSNFDKNQGGGVYCGHGGVGDSVTVTNSTFTDNDSPNNHGGGLKILNRFATVTIRDSAFNGNKCYGDGGGLYLGSSATITNCSFSENKADEFDLYFGDGGGICASGTNITLNLDSCGFASNSATWGGGLLLDNYAGSTFKNCHFRDNIAQSGGGMYLIDGGVSTLLMKDGSFKNNRSLEAWGIGGAITCQNASFEIYDSVIQDNSAEGADSSGGGICFYDGSAGPGMHKVWNCLITGNSAAGNGGAISCEIFTGPDIQNCTFSGNSASKNGGGIYVDWSSTFLGGDECNVTNCIFDDCDNQAIYEGGNASDVTVETCDFYRNQHGDYYDFQLAQTIPGTLVGIGNYDLDPMFVVGPLDDYYLDPFSLLIDGGTGDASSICEPVDGNCLSEYTVLVSGVPDSDEVDLGYHRDIVTVPQYILTVTVTAGNGNVEIYPEPDIATGKYYPGMIVKLVATPSRNYRVKSWGGGTLFDNSPSPVSYVIMSSDRDVTIAFEPTAIFYVGDDADYPTIASAVHAAGEGDMIIIPTGIWQEPISSFGGGVVIDKGVIISSENPDDPDCVANTIIDGLRGTNDYVRGAFTFDSFVSGAVLDGLTIRNCGGRVGHNEDGDRSIGHPNGFDGGPNFGGAIIILQGSDPIIRNCIITDNVVHSGDGGNGVGATTDENAGRGGWGGMARGGAVYCAVNSSPTFENCRITNNSVKGGDGGNGGDYAFPGGAGNYGGNYSIAGDFFFDPFTLDIEFIEGDLWEVFESDFAGLGLFGLGLGELGYGGDYRWYSGYGGAVYCGQGSAVTFTDCVISGNRAFGGMSGQGGTIGPHLRPREPLIEYVIPSYGGGVYAAADSTTTFTRCEISDNLAERVGVDFIDEGILLDTSTLPVAYRLDPYLGHGGGVAIEDGSTVVFEDCQISNNEAAVGGGIYWTDDTVMTISNCDVTDNIAYHGAGLHTVKGGDTTSTIIRSVITGNDATVQPEAFPDPDGSGPPVPPEVVLGRGAGLYNASVNINIIDSVFAENEVSASGGGIYFSDTNAEVTVASTLVHNCLFVNNIAGRDGGAVSANWYTEPVIRNCTIADNLANGFFEEGELGTPGYIEYFFGSSNGGGINAENASDVLVTNSIIWGNFADDGKQIALASGLYFAEATVTNSDVQNGESGVYTGGEPGNLTWGTGNINNDPLFVSGPASDYGYYYLSSIGTGQDANSPCIDAGSPGADIVCFNNLCLDEYTNRTDNVFDAGSVDMGYHYPVAELGPPPVPGSEYTLRVEVVCGNGGFAINGVVAVSPFERDYLQGTVVTITAIRDQGWRVGSWTEDGVVSPGNKDLMYLVEIGSDDKIVELCFEPSATITVPGDYTNIQTAIDNAQAGDIVKVSQGVFYGGNIVVDKAITLTSTNPDDPGVVANTIIDGGGYANNRGVIFYPEAGTESVLNGFTFMNFTYFIIPSGDGDIPGEDGGDGGLALGGGIICLPGSSPTVKNCVVTNCDIIGGNGGLGSGGDDTIQYNGRGGWGGAAWGAGIYVGGTELYQYIIREGLPIFLSDDLLERMGPSDVSSPTIINCTVMNNSVTGGNGGNGAGFFRIDDPPAYIDPGYGGLWNNDNEELYPYGSWESMGMTGAYRYYSGYGGGVYCGIGSKPTFEHCLITGNTTRGGMSGLGGDNDGFVRQEPVYNYEIPSYGGGIYCGAESEVKFIDCTIIDNVSPKYTVYGAGDELAEDAPLANDEVGEPRYHVDPYLGHGAGIALDHAASARFENCYIRGNEAAVGGGIFWGYEPSSGLTGTIEIVDCNIVDNLAYLGAGVFGNHGETKITGNLIVGNFAGPDQGDIDNPNMGGQGGGIHLDAVQGMISDCRVTENEATSSGGGIFTTGSSSGNLETVNCLVVGNEAGRDGGGISVNWDSDPSIQNCTIADNIATGAFGTGTSYGGGLSTAYSSNAVVTDSIFWNNFALFGDQIIVATDFEFDLRPSTLKLSYSDVQGGWSGLYIGTGCTLKFGDPPLDPNDFYETNIDDDPCFVNDFYLKQPPNQIGTSPCVNTGSTGAGSICFEGLYGTACLSDYTTSTDSKLDTGVVDMGYHYPQPVLPPQAQLDSCGLCDFPETRDGVINILDLRIMGEWWFDITCSILPFCDGADVTGNGMVNYEDFGLFYYCWLENDANAPTPDRSLWAPGGEPKGSGQTAIAMIAETATDNWQFVEYNFINQGGGCNDSGWQSEPNYVDKGLTPGQYCTYYVITRDGAGNQTDQSVSRSAFVGNDTDPPLPDPSEWLVVPRSDPGTPTTIDMEAVIADDPLPFNSEPVQYFFECTSDPAYSSGWQLSNVYSRDDYVEGTTYSFTVRARDSSANQNETLPSSIVPVTAGIGRDELAPDPNPMIWVSPPQLIQDPPVPGGLYYIQMTAVTAVDPTPAGYDGGYDVQYYFECEGDAGKSSGWIDPADPPFAPGYYRVQVPDQFDNYYFNVKARDMSPNLIETAPSCSCYSGTPLSCPNNPPLCN